MPSTDATVIDYHATDDGVLRTAVFHLMTMPFTLRLRHADEPTLRGAAESCRDLLSHVDRTFSPFRDDSLTSRANRGDWGGLLDDPDFHEVYARAAMAADLTHGHFRAMRDGRYDPVGLVKGWAIERAFTRFLRPLLDAGRAEAAALGGGGDMQLGVASDSDFVWGVGIEDPRDAGMLAGTVRLADGAVATSGTSKRGEHIDRTADDLIQATVVGTHLTDADMWATTAIAAGRACFGTLVAGESDPLFSALLIDRDGVKHVVTPHPTAVPAA